MKMIASYVSVAWCLLLMIGCSTTIAFQPTTTAKSLAAASKAFVPHHNKKPSPSLRVLFTPLRASGDDDNTDDNNNNNNSGGLFGFLKSSPPKEESDMEVIERMYDEQQQSKDDAALQEAVASTAASTASSESDDDAKFGFGARIESAKSVVVGALAGGIALAPAALVRDIVVSGQSVAQWELDTDMGSLQTALFAIVYRYCIREDTNPQLKDGVVGAFALTRTLSRLQVPSYCSAVPLNCGAPTGYFDWNLLGQLAMNGAEAGIMFFATASAMEYCFEKGYISKFPG